LHTTQKDIKEVITAVDMYGITGESTPTALPFLRWRIGFPFVLRQGLTVRYQRGMRRFALRLGDLDELRKLHRAYSRTNTWLFNKPRRTLVDRTYQQAHIWYAKYCERPAC